MKKEDPASNIRLPEPDREGKVPVEKTIRVRRSLRDFSPAPLEREAIAQLLWSAQGITHPDGLRTAPSAGALYPLELTLVARNVRGVPRGVYRYRPGENDLVPVTVEDPTEEIPSACLDQQWIGNAPAIVAVSAVFERTTGKYGERGIRYVHMEVGHLAQNVHLQAESLGLGTVVVGAFDDRRVKQLLKLPSAEKPMVLLPVGRKA